MASRSSSSFAGTPGTKIARGGARPSRRTTARHGNGISSTYLNGLASKPFVCGYTRRLRRGLFEQLPQILKHDVFFVRARAIGDKELLAQVQCFSLHCTVS